MTKREEYLSKWTYEIVKFGSISNDLKESGRDIRVSDSALDYAEYKGKEIRDGLYKKIGYWEIADHEEKCREAVRRYLSCGHRLDTPEAKELIIELHSAKDLKNEASEKVDKLIAAWQPARINR